MKGCHSCGTEWESEAKQPAVKEYCEACTAYLHCCLNCRHYAPSAHNQCYIPTTDWVGDRRGANFCDEFEFADTEDLDRDTMEQEQAREALDDFFGGGEADPSSFDDLFGD